MSDGTERRGTCLCRATHIIAKSMSDKVGACHCRMCRRWGGGPYMAVDCGTDVLLEGEENITIYNSSDWAERGFCKKCGTHLFYRLKETQQYIASAGIFGDDHAYIFDHQIFIDEKPSHYSFANKTNDMTGEEVFAKCASSSG